MIEYVGGIHIHSNYSDGLRPIPEITSIAQKVGLDFLMFSDHRTLQPIKMGLEGWYDNVLALIGYENNDANNQNHYLIFGLDEILPPNYSANEYVAAARKQGALGIIAHPDEKRQAFAKYPPYPWTAWDAEGFDGIEIWNHTSEWMELLTPKNKFFHVLHPLKDLKGPYPETLKRWDELNREKAVPGIGGIDAHAFPYHLWLITIYIFRYKVLFKSIRTHILVEQPLPREVQDAKRMVYEAIRNAHCFISNHRWGDARGFSFTATAEDTIFDMGDTITHTAAEFKAETPLKSTLRLLRDGETIAESEGKSLRFIASEPGAYRLEAYRKGKAWIYSNHIRLRGTHD